MSSTYTITKQFYLPSLTVGDGPYSLETYADFAYTVTDVWIETSAGTVTADFKIGSTSITGLSSVAVTAANTVVHGTATGANSVSVGNQLSVTFSSPSSDLAGIQFTLAATRNAVSSISNSDGTLTISPTTGDVVASLNLGNANTWTANQTFNGNIYCNGLYFYGTTTQRSGAAFTMTLGSSNNGYDVSITTNNTMMIMNNPAAGYYQYATFNQNGSQVGSITVGTSSTAYNTTSDKRFKANVQPVVNSGTMIDAMKPSTFDWLDLPGKQKGTGFLAQDLYKIFPDAVTPGDDDDAVKDRRKAKAIWSADYSKLVPILVAEIKDLRARVARLETKK